LAQLSVVVSLSKLVGGPFEEHYETLSDGGYDVAGRHTGPRHHQYLRGSDALFAGSGQPATSSQLVAPNNVAVDSQGNIYFSDSGLSMVLKVATNGVISMVAGNGLTSGGGDGGLATGATLGFSRGFGLRCVRQSLHRGLGQQ
jgi:hypothetical protein